VHCRTFGQIKHSSWVSIAPGGALSNPLKWAHFAGLSKTMGYSVGFTSTIFSFSVMMFSLLMQNGQA
jgi:hypothetical protein